MVTPCVMLETCCCHRYDWAPLKILRAVSTMPACSCPDADGRAFRTHEQSAAEGSRQMDNLRLRWRPSVAWRACACRPANDSSAIPLTTHQSHGNYFHYFPTETATCFEYIKRGSSPRESRQALRIRSFHQQRADGRDTTSNRTKLELKQPMGRTLKPSEYQ